MYKRNNHFLLILIALVLAVSPLRGMSASSMGLAEELAGSDSGCPHINMDMPGPNIDGGLDSDMQEDCCENNCNSDAGCDRSCFHAGAGITGAVGLIPDIPLTGAPAFFFDHYSNHSFSPPLRPPARFYS